MSQRGTVTQNTADVEQEDENGFDEVFGPVKTAAEDAGVEVTTEIIEGTTADTLIEHIETRDIDLVVMGTHGKSGLSRVLLGSTAEEIVRNSPVPVLTVRSQGQ